MRPGRIAPSIQIEFWVGDWAACVWLTRAHHPTLAIGAMATACLIAACALAVYVDALVLVPRLWRSGHRAIYIGALIGVVAVAGASGVAVIQVVYDLAWGPDPARYGLGFNLATDTLGVALHVAVAKAIVWVMSKGLRKA